MDFQVNIYNVEPDGRCKADLQIADLNLCISGFRVVPGTNGKGTIVHMPKGMGTDWKYKEIEWAKVRELISGEYQKNFPATGNNKQPSSVSLSWIEFHSVKKEYQYRILICDEAQIIGEANLVVRNDNYTVEVEDAVLQMLASYEVGKEDLEELSKAALGNETVLPEKRNQLYVEIKDCTDFTIYALADFILPGSQHRWKDFQIKEKNNGDISIHVPRNLNGRWENKHYPWKKLCRILQEEYRKFKETDKPEDDKVIVEAEAVTEESADESVETIEKVEVVTKKQPIAKNKLGRICNAENTAFAFVPHSILKLEPMENSKENITQRVVWALNNPNGGIGVFEIELLDWISKLKYVPKTIILDLVLSGYISMGKRENITTAKMTDVMNRLYKYDLIEMSRLTSVDDNGDSQDEGRHSVYRIHTLGTTGYNLLKEMGRHPERRNPFGVLADGNTVKKCLSANQWLGYWLTHYAAEDVHDYTINTIVNQMGIKWTGAKVYATVTLGSVTLVAEPIRRCEEFEQESDRNGIRGKLLRMIEVFDDEDHLYTSKREQVVFAARPIITYICEDEEHMAEHVECVRDLIEAYPRQEVWFTTDLRMFNYNGAGRRFLVLKDGELSVLDLEQKIGVREMSMEERGGQ